MDNTKHTPGPWKIYPTSGKELIETVLHTIDSPRVYVAMMEDGNSKDAILIACAPELLEALENAADEIEAYDDHIYFSHDLRKLIKKAKGG